MLVDLALTISRFGSQTTAVDSASGTITRDYDNLDRLFSETTSQGLITYQFDLAGEIRKFRGPPSCPRHLHGPDGPRAKGRLVGFTVFP